MSTYPPIVTLEEDLIFLQDELAQVNINLTLDQAERALQEVYGDLVDAIIWLYQYFKLDLSMDHSETDLEGD
jgi:hypothetical protein